MPFEESDSGLVLPQQPKQPEKPRGPLEIEDADLRAEVGKLLQDLHFKLNTRGGIQLPGKGTEQVAKSRIRHLEALAVELLGVDVCFEELT